MRRRDPRVPLWDIGNACEQLQKFGTGKTFGDYQAEQMLRLAVERLFITVGEAATRLRDINPLLMSRTTSSQQIVGFRNHLVHGYDTIADNAVWRALQDDVPVLHAEVIALLAELDTESGDAP